MNWWMKKSIIVQLDEQMNKWMNSRDEWFNDSTIKYIHAVFAMCDPKIITKKQLRRIWNQERRMRMFNCIICMSIYVHKQTNELFIKNSLMREWMNEWYCYEWHRGK